MSAAILIIGIGNPYRGDDALGCLIVDEIKSQCPVGAEIIQHSGEPASLIDLWQGRRCAILVDAVSSGAQAGTIHRIDFREQSLPDQFRSYSTHAFGIAEAVELARALNKLPPTSIFYGIEGKNFSINAPLSTSLKKKRQKN
ncbi:hydrogenase maturation protease [Nitrosococcus oceani]|uniref:hydrogenase maturation protease n=1 Tax=Nitrosococcus oceani TaxID=1229 RepID=UPI00068B4950|nr:hydrogenase maturation protease [Nitrosococcus oceani]